MNKNTVIAIVLSTVVIVGFFILQPLIFGRKNNVEKEIQQTTESVESLNTENSVTSEAVLTSSEILEEESSEEVLKVAEENFVIETDLLKVEFTNKGGDIISYQLKKQTEKIKGQEEPSPIQLSDSITDFNRTCSISLGNVENLIINDIFEIVEKNDLGCTFRQIVNYQGKKYAIEKAYTFKNDEYLFKLDVAIHCLSDGGMNFDNVAYTIRTSPQIGPHYDIKTNRYEYRQYVSYDGSKYRKKNLGTGQFKRADKDFIWEGIAGKYFVEIINPVDASIINSGFYSTQAGLDNYNNAQVFMQRNAFSTNNVKDTYYMYFGPRDEKELKRYNVAEKNGWGISEQKLTQCLPTSGFLSWLEIALKWCLEMLHKVIKNWGICIIVLTIILKAAMFPISRKQSMSTLKMQQVQPRINEIQQKYKDDPKRVQAETAKLYQEAGYNPASGCLPMILQFLVLFAMYNLFNNYFDFRGSEFIKGWIDDLSTGDSVLQWNKQIPLISGFTGNNLRILPIIYLATQIFYGIITQYGGTSQNSKSMKFMTYGMPAIFFFLFYSAPAGLLIYWIISNIFQMGQQLLINKMMENKKKELNLDKKEDNRKLPPKAKSKIKKEEPVKKGLFGKRK